MQVKCCRRQVSSESCHIFVSNIGPERESCDSGVSVAYSNHGCNTDHSLRVNFPIVSAAAVQCDRQRSGAGASDSGPVEKITSSLSQVSQQPRSLTHSRSQTASGWWAAASPPSSSGTWRRSIFTISSSRTCPASSRRSRIPHQDSTRKS